jgi:hypothetical protein
MSLCSRQIEHNIVCVDVIENASVRKISTVPWLMTNSQIRNPIATFETAISLSDRQWKLHHWKVWSCPNNVTQPRRLGVYQAIYQWGVGLRKPNIKNLLLSDAKTDAYRSGLRWGRLKTVRVRPMTKYPIAGRRRLRRCQEDAKVLVTEWDVDLSTECHLRIVSEGWGNDSVSNDYYGNILLHILMYMYLQL